MSYTPGCEGPPIDEVPYEPADWNGRCPECGETRGIRDRFHGTASDGWTGYVYTPYCGHTNYRVEQL